LQNVRWRRRPDLSRHRTIWAEQDAALATARIGHNGGPPLDPVLADPDASWRMWCWKRAVKRAWKTPPREIALRRLARAEAVGMTYRQYTLEILERGVFPAALPGHGS
jgi:hypothetical protein